MKETNRLMPQVERRYSKEENASRGDAVYTRDVRPRLKPTDDGKFVAMDIETGDYEVAADALTACDQLRKQVPQAQTWLSRVGSRWVHRL